MLVLAEPDIRFERIYRDMMAEWAAAGEKPLPWVLQEDASVFPALVEKLKGLAHGIDVPEGFAPSTTFFAYKDDEDRLVGAVNIRHWLTGEAAFWGHIGYGVRPGQRKKGYATAMLNMAVKECRRLGIEKALVTCEKNNIASARTILKNGGVLEGESIEPRTGRMTLQYWIKVPE